MTAKAILLTAAAAAALAVLGAGVSSAQPKPDKYAVQVPNGLSLSEFRGYEGWEVVSVAKTDEVIKVIVANPVMIEAFKSGVPGNDKPFPDGSKIAKIQWVPKKSTEAPFDVSVPDHLKDLFLIEKDSKRFADIAGWGYAQFDYDAAADAYKPNPGGVINCGTQCHTIVKAKDYIFHPYQKR
ncbi:MAG: cytochrome P460 family protein [Reyranellales bacterium]